MFYGGNVGSSIAKHNHGDYFIIPRNPLVDIVTQ